MTSFVRNAVSKKKKRYRRDGFDLDLSYILPNVIAMGFPSQDIEGMYRNKLSTVRKFLDFYHRQNWKVYNLCSERDYDVTKFDGKVARFGFDDHNPPPLQLMFDFVQDLQHWLNASDKHVAAIHCKAVCFRKRREEKQGRERRTKKKKLIIIILYIFFSFFIFFISL
jgi:phosphatidylinositol-3,4,5-trisphosphate 3-phosphatase and dual-specificity protein phosphatase PTEN